MKVSIVGATGLARVGAMELTRVGAKGFDVGADLATNGWAAGCLAERSNSRHAEQRQG
jgi:hypothetical protein